jgi:hypothetical protein
MDYYGPADQREMYFRNMGLSPDGVTPLSQAPLPVAQQAQPMLGGGSAQSAQYGQMQEAQSDPNMSRFMALPESERAKYIAGGGAPDAVQGQGKHVTQPWLGSAGGYGQNQARQYSGFNDVGNIAPLTLGAGPSDSGGGSPVSSVFTFGGGGGQPDVTGVGRYSPQQSQPAQQNYLRATDRPESSGYSSMAAQSASPYGGMQSRGTGPRMPSRPQPSLQPMQPQRQQPSMPPPVSQQTQPVQPQRRGYQEAGRPKSPQPQMNPGVPQQQQRRTAPSSGGVA